MRRLLAVFILCSVLGCAKTPESFPPPAASRTTSLQELRLTLTLCANDTSLTTFATDVANRLAGYDSLFTLARTIAGIATYDIDIIGQIHLSPRGAVPLFGPNQAFAYPEVWLSQQAIKWHLEHHVYDLIAVEAYALNPLTLVTLAADLGHSWTPDSSGVVDTVAAYEYFHIVRQYRGWLDYLLDHPQAAFIGGEDSALHALHGAALGYFAPTDSTFQVTYQDTVSHMLIRIRNEVAVAKTLIELHRRGQHRTAIIMGALHENDLEVLMKQYGVKSQTYSMDPRKAEFWKQQRK